MDITKSQYEFALAKIEELLPMVSDEASADDKDAIELSILSDVVIEYSNPLYESVRTGGHLLEESSSTNTPLSRVRKTLLQISLRGNSMDPRIRSTMIYWTPRRIFYSAIETSVSQSR